MSNVIKFRPRRRSFVDPETGRRYSFKVTGAIEMETVPVDECGPVDCPINRSEHLFDTPNRIYRGGKQIAWRDSNGKQHRIKALQQVIAKVKAAVARVWHWGDGSAIPRTPLDDPEELTPEQKAEDLEFLKRMFNLK